MGLSGVQAIHLLSPQLSGVKNRCWLSCTSLWCPCVALRLYFQVSPIFLLLLIGLFGSTTAVQYTLSIVVCLCASFVTHHIGNSCYLPVPMRIRNRFLMLCLVIFGLFSVFNIPVSPLASRVPLTKCSR